MESEVAYSGIGITVDQEAEFLAKSIKFGHSPQALSEGNEEVTFFTIPDLKTAGEYFCNATEAQKAERLKTFFHSAITARARLGQGMHDRGEAHIYAGAELNPADSRGLSNHLPFHAKAVSVFKKVIKSGEVWDVSVRGEVWGLDYMEELYVGLNIGTLILEPGAKLIIRGNVFSVLCQKIVCLPDPEMPEQDYHIGILPTPFSVDFGWGPHNGKDGETGRNGEEGIAGRQVVTEKTLLGHRLTEDIDAADLNGSPGADGLSGQAGGKGRNGGMCKIAELVFRQVEGELRVFSQAGSGGDGGRGGNGGDAGAGGEGTDGHKLIRGLLIGGKGGSFRGILPDHSDPRILQR